MNVRQAMTPNTDCVGPNDRAMAAEELLEKNHVESLPVLDHHVVAGSLRSEDIDDVSSQTGVNRRHLSVRDTMKHDALTVLDTDELEAAQRAMDEHKMESVTVRDAENKIVGILKRRTTV